MNDDVTPDLNSADRLLTSIYRSSKQDEMYLYVKKSQGLKPVPASLLARFGEPTWVMDLLMTPTKSLARAEAAKVISAIQAQGFYLQLPPQNPSLLPQE